MNAQTDSLLTTSQVAQTLFISVEEVRRLCKAGLLSYEPRLWSGAPYLIHADSVKRFQDRPNG